jgi:arylsulfatase A-like enzyme
MDTNKNQQLSFMTLKLFIGLILIISSSFLSAKEKVKTPNIILIMADDMGWGDMSFRGNPIQKTPHLDKMADEGIVFNRFYSASAVCAPTRASVMTGSTPQRIDMMNCCSGHIRSYFELLPEYFRERGYSTGHFGKWHLGTLSKDSVDFPEQGRDPAKDYSPPWENGFDVCFSTHNVVPTWNPMDVPDQGGNWFCQQRSDDGWWGQHYFDDTGKMYSHEDPMLKGDDSRIIMDRALPFIESQVKKGKPFLTAIWFHAPHTPTVADGGFLEMYAEHEGRHHYGAISAMDAQIGRLRKCLDQLGVSENTLIWFCSDNGAAKYNPNFDDYGGYGSNGPFRGWKTQLYEGGIRVPGILLSPKRLKHQEISAPCTTSDIYPTLVDLIWNTKPAQPEDGMSLLPILTGVQTNRGKSIGFEMGKRNMVMMDDRYKLHRIQDSEIVRWELYDLINDRSENNNIADANPVVLKRLKRELEDWNSGCETDLTDLKKKDAL